MRALLFLWATACSSTLQPVSVSTLPGHESLALDTTPKERRRMVPPEVYIRSYLTLFGGLAPLAAQNAAHGKGGLFDTWDDYLSLLGLPDYKIDIPRAAQTNALMMATFERLGIALCDRAVERDLAAKPPLPVGERMIFAFDVTAAPLDLDGFATRFDVLHQAFLGYPSALAPPGRIARFYALYADVVRRHSDKKAPKSLFTPAQAGWAAVCYGLIRHPEFHLY